MRHLLTASIVCVALATSYAAELRAEELTIGDAAPKLEVKEFIKGDPLAKLESGSVYVVEFWATWCGPCRVAMPHLTELQKKYPDVKFVGVSVWEQDQDLVKPFVEKMGDKMGYRVAMDSIPKNGDGNDGAMAKNWLKAAELNGIPASFIVGRDLKIAWIGHPGKIDKPLAKIVEGDWDLAAALADREKQKFIDKKFSELIDKVKPALEAGKLERVMVAVDEAMKETPDLTVRLSFVKYNLLSQMGDEAKAVQFGRTLLSRTDESNAEPLNSTAWGIVGNEEKTSKELRAFALDCAKRADELEQGKNPVFADTLARAYFKNGNTAAAIKTQQRALELAKGTHLANESHELQDRLDEYLKAAGDKK